MFSKDPSAHAHEMIHFDQSATISDGLNKFKGPFSTVPTSIFSKYCENIAKFR